MTNSVLGRITPLHLQVRLQRHIARAPRSASSGEILMTQPSNLISHSAGTQHSCCMPSFASSDIFGVQLPRSSLLLESNTWLRFRFVCFLVNDPSAGSPTETLLRLLLPLNVKAYSTLPMTSLVAQTSKRLQRVRRNVQSVEATGGVYKGQGRNQCKLMTCAY